MTTPSSIDPFDSSRNEPPERPPSRSAIVAAICVTLGLAIGSLGVLFYRAATTPQPSRAIVVRGNADWDGLELTVSGGTLDKPQVTKFEELGKYIVPFYLPPGKYTLEIKNDGTVVYHRDVDVTQHTEDIDLVRAGVTTRPATAPSTMPSILQPMTTTVPSIPT